MTGSVYRAASGDDFNRLHPVLQAYFAHEGTVRVTGVFDEVGCRKRWLAPLLQLGARLGLLTPEYGRDVPFDASLTPHRGGISTVRRLQFANGEHVLHDRSWVVGGRLIDAHAGGRLLVAMKSAVLPDGSVTFTSVATRVRVGRTLLRAPNPTIRLHQGWDESATRFRLVLTVRLPVIGEIFTYRGHFVTHELPNEGR